MCTVKYGVLEREVLFKFSTYVFYMIRYFPLTSSIIFVSNFPFIGFPPSAANNDYLWSLKMDLSQSEKKIVINPLQMGTLSQWGIPRCPLQIAITPLKLLRYYSSASPPLPLPSRWQKLSIGCCSSKTEVKLPNYVFLQIFNRSCCPFPHHHHHHNHHRCCYYRNILSRCDILPGCISTYRCSSFFSSCCTRSKSAPVCPPTSPCSMRPHFCDPSRICADTEQDNFTRMLYSHS